MVYEYIIKNYQEAEPIYLSDIEIDEMPRVAISKQLKKISE